MRTLSAALLLLFCLAPLAHADVVILRNGDKLTGTLVDAQKTEIILRSDALGTLKIPLNHVQSLTCDGRVVVVTRDRKALEGELEYAGDGAWTVNRNGTTQTIEGNDLNVAMPATPYLAAVESATKPWRLWNGSLNIGYNIQNGDQRSNTLSTFVSAVRQLPENLTLSEDSWRTNYNLVLLFSSASQNGASVSSNTFSSSLRQDYLFSPRNFVFVFGQVDHIESQGLTLRHTAGSGFGRDLIRSKRTVLSTLESLNYEHHKFSTDLAETSTEARIGETLGLQLMSRVRLDHTFNFYQNILLLKKYRSDANANLSFQLNKHLSFNTGVVNLYLSHPVSGRQRNSFIFTTGLGFKFAQ